MKGGTLSNQVAPGVGVRFEHCVYNYGKINQPGRAFLDKLLNIDCNIYLITMLGERKVKSICYKWGLPYTYVLQADSTLEISELCRAHHLQIYYDTDDRVLEAVSARGNPKTEAQKWIQST